ncbi:class I adenylate-forming enzyme family protein [Cohnella soli]|uniref:Class I adenylate-forming enzyme family protein n=1 Tax=Cohnella soli TaxID=425005 RepID=A0ABW0I1F2_9BACL
MTCIFPTFIKEVCGRHADRIAYRHIDQTDCSYAELNAKTDRLAAYFLRNGVRPGYKMAFMCDNPMHAVFGYVACLKIGVTCIPINVEIENPNHLFQICQPDGIFVTQEIEARIRAYIPANAKIYSLDSRTPYYCNDSDFSTSEINSLALGTRRLDENDPAFIFFTSGSTGSPKGVVLSHRNIVYYAMHGASPYRIRFDDVFICLSAFHSDMSLFPLFLPLRYGASCLLINPASRWNPSYIWRCITEKKVTTLFVVPSMLKLMLFQELREAEAESVRYLIISGEKASMKDLLTARTVFGQAQFINLYGNTESNDIMFYRIPSRLDNLSELPLGTPMPYVSALIVNESMNVCEDGEIGELYIHSPTLMSGYRRIDTEINDFVSVNGTEKKYFPTKDLVWRKENVYYFAGRKDNMIKVHAQRVFPSLVETVLQRMPNVIEAAVFPIHRAGSAALAAFLYGSNISNSEARDYCAQHLPAYSIPKKFVIVEKSLPKTNTGKFDYIEIEREYL